jgi:hypothetical protein
MEFYLTSSKRQVFSTCPVNIFRPVQLKLNFHFASAAREFKLLEAISEAVPTAIAY